MTPLAPPIDYVFHCKRCEQPMWLLAENCGRLFEPPIIRTIESDFLAVVCPYCKHLGRYTLLKDHPEYNPLDMAISAIPRALETHYLGLLPCDARSCGFRLPLVALWSASMTGEQRAEDLSTWKWADLKCRDGHSIPKPPRM
jgi:hypothetical protein